MSVPFHRAELLKCNSFEEYVCQTITHEILHKVTDVLEGREACKAIDSWFMRKLLVPYV